MAQVFITHADADLGFATALARALENLGYSTWSSASGSPGGSGELRWPRDRVAASEAVVAIISQASVGSPQVSRDVMRAFDKRKRLKAVARGATLEEFAQRQTAWQVPLLAKRPQELRAGGFEELALSIAADLLAVRIMPSRRPPTAPTAPVTDEVAPVAVRSSGPGANRLGIDLGHFKTFVSGPGARGIVLREPSVFATLGGAGSEPVRWVGTEAGWVVGHMPQPILMHDLSPAPVQERPEALEAMLRHCLRKAGPPRAAKGVEIVLAVPGNRTAADETALASGAETESCIHRVTHAGRCSPHNLLLQNSIQFR